MILIEKHIIKQNHLFFNECDNICFKSKNLYNQGLYNVRQFYFENKKYLNYTQNYHITKNQDSYKHLPTKVACQTLKMVENNFKSFFVLIQRKKDKQYSEKIKIPNYLDKETGRYLTKFPKQSLSLREFKKSGKIKLSQTNILINTKVINWDSIKEVRIVPRLNFYVIEVVYEKQEKENNYSTVAAIDSGLNNLATVTYNDKNNNPFIINGKPLKSINQYYNKKLSNLKGELELKQKRKKSKNISKLTNKRNNKVNDYLHKASRLLVNQLVSDKTGILIIGKNIGQKQDINIGKVNNQNFVSIPIFRFLDMVVYKAKLEGIKVIYQEESYTSKCSFLDNEEICKHDKYQGKRIKRGLYRSKEGKLINADVNGSYNIMKKGIPNAFADGIEGVGVHPIKFNI